MDVTGHERTSLSACTWVGATIGGTVVARVMPVHEQGSEQTWRERVGGRRITITQRAEEQEPGRASGCAVWGWAGWVGWGMGRQARARIRASRTTSQVPQPGPRPHAPCAGSPHSAATSLARAHHAGEFEAPPVPDCANAGASSGSAAASPAAAVLPGGPYTSTEVPSATNIVQL